MSLTSPFVNITDQQLKWKCYRANRKMKKAIQTAYPNIWVIIARRGVQVNLTGVPGAPEVAFIFRPQFRTNNEGRLYFSGWEWADWSSIGEHWNVPQGTTTDPIEFLAKRCGLTPRNSP